MRVEPPGEGKKQPPGAEESRQAAQPGGKNFADALRDMEREALKKAFDAEREMSPGPAKIKEPTKEKEKKKEKEKVKEKQAQPQHVQQEAKGEAKVEMGTGTMKTGASSQIQRILDLFPVGSAIGVTHVQTVSQQGQTTVVVALANGMEVSIDVAPGGRDLNVLVKGVSEAAQARMENQQNLQALNQKLGQLGQGVTVHWVQTQRGEQLEARPGEGAAQEEGRGEEEEGEKG